MKYRSILFWIVMSYLGGVSIGYAQLRIEEIPIAPLYPTGHGLYGTYVFSDGTVVAVGGEGTLLWSRDTFRTYRYQKIAEGEYRTIFGFTYAGGLIVVGEDGLCYRKVTEWQPVTLPVRKTLYDIVRLRGITSFAVGADGTILESNDGGIRWEQRASGTTKDLRAIDSYKNYLIAVGEDGVIVRSTDGGYSWTVIRSSGLLKHDLFDVVALTKHRWIAVGRKTTMARSTDGGETWSERQLLSTDAENINLMSIWFADSLHGWLAGQTPSLEQMVWETTDGGQSWQSVPCVIDTPETNWDEGTGWSAYPTAWWSIVRLGDRLILFGERDQNSIIAVQDTNGSWRRLVWDRLTGLTRLGGGWIDECDQIVIALGYPPDPRIIQFDVRQDRWTTLFHLPFVDVERFKHHPQLRYRGERVTGITANGSYWLANSDFSTCWWSSDGGTTWSVLRNDTIAHLYDIEPFGTNRFIMRAKIYYGPLENSRSAVLRLEADGKTFTPLLYSADFWIQDADFLDTLRGWAVIKTGNTSWKILRTVDGGQQWDTIGSLPIPDHPEGRVKDPEIDQIQVLDENQIAVILSAVIDRAGSSPKFTSAILRSSDGGYQWDAGQWLDQQVSRWRGYNNNSAVALRIVDKKYWLIFFEHWNHALFSHDSGRSWQGIPLPYERDGGALVGFSGRCAAIVKFPFVAGGQSLRKAPALLWLIHLPTVTLDVQNALPQEQKLIDGVRIIHNGVSADLILHIEPSRLSTIKDVLLFDLKGQILAHSAAEPIVQLPTAHIASGTYYVGLRQASGFVHIIPVSILR